ncbi:PglL family O-oligosaccharyltransferase [Chromobacterium aquaticum]|uniref:Wzy polymerase domain-containing protein n=1 Tax=Chromobacterium aquaticum TaxID=467180 RepID=A0ABV8ZTH2_9NEIS|nr:Wzy polymerase domain-containing protein [Chromobacterium aquaticum]
MLPMFSFFRFYPLPDWSSSAACLAFVALAILVAVFSQARERFSNAALTVLFFAIYCLLQSGVEGYSFSLVLFLFFVLLLYVPFCAEENLECFVAILARVIVFSALLQSLLGWMQLLALAPKMHGFVLFDANGAVFGNIGQRNLYADFLMWGVVSACYLFAISRLNGFFLILCLIVFALMVAWSRSRMSLVYGAGLVFLAWFWWCRSRPDVIVRRMVAALLGFVVLLCLVQIFSHTIIQVLHCCGLSINVQSGSERLLRAGLGGRRFIEWTKAWYIFKEYPFFGVGVGGFSAESVRMEVYAGLPKSPESWLFTHSHNLVFQLLAEAGLVGCFIVVVGVVASLLGFLCRGRQSAENLLLISVAMVILFHSFFEYPLWYLPYLLMFCLVCALSPGQGRAMEVNSSLFKFASVLVVVICFFYVALGSTVFVKLVRYSVPAAAPKMRAHAIEELTSVAGYPLWSLDVDMALANYIEPSTERLPVKLQLFSRIANYRPYPGVLVKLSMLQALNGQPELARETMRMAIANYPDYTARFVLMLAARPEREMRPLQAVAMSAAAASTKYPADPDQARLASVMTVAEPVTRKPLF